MPCSRAPVYPDRQIESSRFAQHDDGPGVDFTKIALDFSELPSVAGAGLAPVVQETDRQGEPLAIVPHGHVGTGGIGHPSARHDPVLLKGCTWEGLRQARIQRFSGARSPVRYRGRLARRPPDSNSRSCIRRIVAPTILYDGPMNRFGLTEVRVQGFRTFKDVRLRPGSLSVLVGEANAGKSNLLTAIRTLLDPDAPPLLPSDEIDGTDGPVRIEGRMADRTRVSLKGTAHGSVERIGSAPVVFVPAALRGGRVLEPAAELAGTSSRAAGSLAAAMVELVSAGGGLAGESGTGPANASCGASRRAAMMAWRES